MIWHLRRLRRRRAENDIRTLYIAAAGASGGDAVKRLAHNLENEIRENRDRPEPEQVESAMPLNQSDFEAWLRNK